MDPQADESWAVITGWLDRHLPSALEALQPPATSASISALRQAMGRRLPSDLIAWLNLTNGFTQRGPFGNLIPLFHTPITCQNMIIRRETLQRRRRNYSSDSELLPAGTASAAWLDAFLPISDTGTSLDLLIDLRDGDHYGCIGEFSPEGGGFVEIRWTGVSAMLAEIAAALASYPQDTYNPPVPVPWIDEDRLLWSI